MNREKQLSLLERITIIPGLMSGKPTIRGLRFTVSDVLELLADGVNHQEILNQHPILEEEDIQAALLFASMRMNNTASVYAA